MEGYEKNTFYHYGHAKVPLTRVVILYSTIVISSFLQCGFCGKKIGERLGDMDLV